jgi:hypothetical protein
VSLLLFTFLTTTRLADCLFTVRVPPPNPPPTTTVSIRPTPLHNIQKKPFSFCDSLRHDAQRHVPEVPRAPFAGRSCRKSGAALHHNAHHHHGCARDHQALPGPGEAAEKDKAAGCERCRGQTCAESGCRDHYRVPERRRRVPAWSRRQLCCRPHRHFPHGKPASRRR